MPPTAVPSVSLAMLLADSRLPVGAHVVSGALEAALLDGLPREQVGAYMRARMATIVQVEAGTAVVARQAAAAGRAARGTGAPGEDGPDADAPGADAPGSDGLGAAALAEVARAWEARTPARPQREIGIALGDGLARLARTVWPEAFPARAGRGPHLPRPVVLGAIAAHAGLTAVDLVRLVAYDDAQTVASALLKLEPGDPLAAAGLVLEACAALEPSVPELSRLTSPTAIPAAGAPQIEEWATAQSVLPRRLFRA
ncbi:urease accessory protein UreF [Brachybacterium phenoliresistens]|uniref:Urease accessory protein UreF n=1 Tax=Brachybacterium phenoliresistens TaxID=396014 RepID=Z9JU26_9MICO|nr:urease accessory UreF family protein [Brachybacterium phenoliresistens]EWS81272.1 urease accessory protein UreF [Brachybacterium phenoliresistens]